MEQMDKITIRGARTHNLRNISLSLSGSGKSSLAFDTLYAEGQRRYVESLSSYARQFLSLVDKPDVDSIEGLSPAISIEQKSTSHNPRSTVGTITEIQDYLRLLWARAGEARCPEHGTVLKAQTVTELTDAVMALPAGAKLFEELSKDGFIRARVDGEICDLSDPPKLGLRIKHTIEIVVDRFKIRPDIRQRVADSVETALGHADGLCIAAPMDEHNKKDEILFSSHYSCPICGYSIPELEPRDFSFNNPHGACPKCDGLGSMMVFDEKKIVPDPEKSVYDGAIAGWDRRYIFYYRYLEQVAEHYHIDLHRPFKDLTDRERKLFLYGTGEPIPMEFVSSNKVEKRFEPFEGVIPNYERRLPETEAEYVREYIGTLMTPLPCPECHGARIKKEYRHVFVAGKSLPEVCDMSISEAYDFFSNLKLDTQQEAIARRLLKEVRARLSFLVNVGLG